MEPMNDLSVEFGPNDGKKWDSKKLAETADIAKEVSAQRSPELKLKNRMLSVRYRMEEYLQDQEIEEDGLTGLDYWLKEYLKVLNLTQQKFAGMIDNKDVNLITYLKGERRFSTDLAMKFGHFFHTKPDLWLNIQIKNDVLLLSKEKKTTEKYTKYDYEKMLKTAS